MIAFRTEVVLPKVSRLLSYRRNVLMVGSCFTENIGSCLQTHYFPVSTNPCGVLYNPASIAACLERVLVRKLVCEEELFSANGLWNNFAFHSKFSHPDKSMALAAMNGSVEDAAVKLKSASHLFLTFGTSWIYREKANSSIVGNCHKLPANRFVRERLSVAAMTEVWIELLDRLFAIHPEIHVVLTISPIRHLRDGSYENQVSKSGLFLLADQLMSHFGLEKLTYFPSYELVMDELRDYRFYASDMLHLSETATAFVQEKFNEVFLDMESKEISFTVGKIVKTLLHKPFNSDNSSYQDLLSRLHEEAMKTAFSYPFVDFSRLINEIVQKKGI